MTLRSGQEPASVEAWRQLLEEGQHRTALEFSEIREFQDLQQQGYLPIILTSPTLDPDLTVSETTLEEFLAEHDV